KRCNDFGAGGVSVAIGELADGLDIDLNAVPRKYEGLDGTELAISESQERMAVVLAPEDAPRFMALAAGENLEATIVARVTRSPRLVMRQGGRAIVDLSREFLSSNGARKRAKARVSPPRPAEPPADSFDFAARMRGLAGDLNACSRRGLGERFDATIGSGTVLMPYGGSRQLTPIQAMVAKIPVQGRETTTCSAMAWGYNPFVTERDPYAGAYLAVVESLSKLVASGAGVSNAHLSFQEYFERLGDDPEKWGVPLAALLGALDAQLDLGVAAIGGKDSMSGSFEQLHVPPTLVSFAVSVADAADIRSPEFKRAGSRVRLLAPEYDGRGLPTPESLKARFAEVAALNRGGHLLSCWTPGYGGVAEGILKMALGNRIGFAFDPAFALPGAFSHLYGAFVVELADGAPDAGEPLGTTIATYRLAAENILLPLDELEQIYENKLEGVFPVNAGEGGRVAHREHCASSRVRPRATVVRPRALIPVFPGTNCEWDTARALSLAGARPEIVVIRNLTPRDVAQSVERVREALEQSQIVMLPGGFSGGDEPDGSGKFITAFFRNPAIADEVRRLLDQRDGLIGGICNGFQALIKLGLVPYGEIRDMGPDEATLTFNRIGRHQSRLARVRVMSNISPWLMHAEVGEVQLAPISHGEGRFVCPPALFERLNAAGQIATAYADEQGIPSMDIAANPNGSYMAVEGVTSPDGRVFGKMAHCERYGERLYVNVPGRDGSAMFRGAVDYFR
ncbi:MAG: phosphoribosylformylglycinamidine synthase, partial [Clostridiales bacterium]|nr:phosphoribosylformylglycinamidine synthase [Clostridiales bacterium]